MFKKKKKKKGESSLQGMLVSFQDDVLACLHVRDALKSSAGPELDEAPRVKCNKVSRTVMELKV